MADESDDAPGSDECLVCFLERMLERSGCDGSLRWTTRWRQANAPDCRLESSMRAQGGYCDCEVVINVFGPPSVLGGLPTM